MTLFSKIKNYAQSLPPTIRAILSQETSEITTRDIQILLDYVERKNKENKYLDNNLVYMFLLTNVSGDSIGHIIAKRTDFNLFQKYLELLNHLNPDEISAVLQKDDKTANTIGSYVIQSVIIIGTLNPLALPFLRFLNNQPQHIIDTIMRMKNNNGVLGNQIKHFFELDALLTVAKNLASCYQEVYDASDEHPLIRTSFISSINSLSFIDINNYNKKIHTICEEELARIYKLTDNHGRTIFHLALNIQDKYQFFLEVSLESCKRLDPSKLADIFLMVNKSGETFTDILINRFEKSNNSIIQKQMLLFLQFIIGLENNQVKIILKQPLYLEKTHTVMDGLNKIFTNTDRQPDELTVLYAQINANYQNIRSAHNSSSPLERETPLLLSENSYAPIPNDTPPPYVP